MVCKKQQQKEFRFVHLLQVQFDPGTTTQAEGR